MLQNTTAPVSRPVTQAMAVCGKVGLCEWGDSDPSYLEIAASDRPDAERCQPGTDLGGYGLMIGVN